MSLVMTSGFLLALLVVVGWMFKTGYRFKK